MNTAHTKVQHNIFCNKIFIGFSNLSISITSKASKVMTQGGLDQKDKGTGGAFCYKIWY